MASDWETDDGTPLDECIVFRDKIAPDPNTVREAIRETLRILAERKVDPIAQARAEGAAEERERITAWHRSEASSLRREASLWSEQHARSPVSRLEYAAIVHESSALRIEALAHREPGK